MSQEEIIRAAVAYRLPVFPVAGKVPLTRHGVKDATTVEAKIRLWFGMCSGPNLGIGIATGHRLRCGRYLAVLDVDVKGDAGGDTSLAAAAEASGELIPDTWTVQTPSGGTHFYFGTPEPLRNRVAFLPGLDVRGRGGYVVAPPSPGYRLLRRGKVADAPTWFLEALRPKPAPARPTAAPEIPRGEIGPRYVEVAIERECAAVASAPEGTRNDTLNRAAFSLARFVAEGRADAGGVIRALTIAAVFSGLDEHEIEKTIGSAFGARRVA